MTKRELVHLLTNVPDDGRVDVSGDDIGMIAFNAAANAVVLSAGGRPDDVARWTLLSGEFVGADSDSGIHPLLERMKRLLNRRSWRHDRANPD
jgi:hypothetical protein